MDVKIQEVTNFRPSSSGSIHVSPVGQFGTVAVFCSMDVKVQELTNFRPSNAGSIRVSPVGQLLWHSSSILQHGG